MRFEEMETKVDMALARMLIHTVQPAIQDNGLFFSSECKLKFSWKSILRIFCHIRH